MINQQGLRIPLIDAAVNTEPHKAVAKDLQSAAVLIL